MPRPLGQLNLLMSMQLRHGLVWLQSLRHRPLAASEATRCQDGGPERGHQMMKDDERIAIHALFISYCSSYRKRFITHIPVPLYTFTTDFEFQRPYVCKRPVFCAMILLFRWSAGDTQRADQGPSAAAEASARTGGRGRGRSYDPISIAPIVNLAKV